MQVNVEQFGDDIRSHIGKAYVTYNLTVTFNPQMYSFASAWLVDPSDILDIFPDDSRYVLVREMTKKHWPHWHGQIMCLNDGFFNKPHMNGFVKSIHSHAGMLIDLRRKFGRCSLLKNVSEKEMSLVRVAVGVQSSVDSARDYTAYILKDINDTLDKHISDDVPFPIAQNICCATPGYPYNGHNPKLHIDNTIMFNRH